MPESSLDEDDPKLPDDDDDWSRRVETDSQDHPDVHHPAPPELSLKEKLVLRERQRRIETERAKWKRQFALNNQSGEPPVAEEPAVPEAPEELPYPMERFLQDTTTTTEESPQQPEQGVLMERFLHEAVVVENAVQRSVSFDVVEPVPPTAELLHAGDHSVAATNTSVLVEADDESAHEAIPSVADGSVDLESEMGSTTHEEPRVLRLTEADMEEMAAIEEASIGNAPPSERDDLSEVGDLAGFATYANPSHSVQSQDTPTTAMDSSVSRGIASETSQEPVPEQIDSNSPLLASPTPSANDTVQAHPPSEIADVDVHEDVVQPILEDTIHAISSPVPDSPQPTNRQIRPGMVRTLEPPSPVTPQTPINVTGFDFDKDISTPVLATDDSYRDLPGDEWPEAKMLVSPLIPEKEVVDYGTESAPLLVPQVIMTRDVPQVVVDEPKGFVAAAFRRVREMDGDRNPAEAYKRSSVFGKAVPGRLAPLIVTMLAEVPVLVLLAVSSGRLSEVLGANRFPLWIGFLIMSNALSSSVNQQSSSLTTRAISQSQLTSDGLLSWMLGESLVAVLLGVTMGSLLGALAYLASSMDASFGLAIAAGQATSTLVSSLVGPLAPLCGSQAWRGVVETALPDVLGTCAMIATSFMILQLLES